MKAYECWFCGTRIDRDDVHAVRLVISALWHREDSHQAIFAHSTCAASRLAGKSIAFDPEVLS